MNGDKVIIELSSLDALNIAALLEYLKNQEYNNKIILPDQLRNTIDNYNDALAQKITDDHLTCAMAESEVNKLLHETHG